MRASSPSQRAGHAGLYSCPPRMKLAARWGGSEDELQIDQHTVLVSGGSSGLGEACVRRFLRHGAKVIIADLAPPDAELTCEFGSRVFFQPTDVTREDDVRA